MTGALLAHSLDLETLVRTKPHMSTMIPISYCFASPARPNSMTETWTPISANATRRRLLLLRWPSVWQEK